MSKFGCLGHLSTGSALLGVWCPIKPADEIMWGQLDGCHIALPHQSRQQESCTTKVTPYTAVTAATINTQYLHYGNTYDIPLHAGARQTHYPPEFVTTHFPPELSRSEKISGNTAGLHPRGELRQCSDASSAESIRP
ncbi:uncharacterized protein PITG_13572 [Phytophthora infestans T30-4]|uniref:Uncharacterized protein n=1 Tax=Phytophthora infestans (strain T30-4) TaxID=403677 RepID=D0NMA8_PHYIT|nr:uncharacterized protein PITG_13572 [Phytophthora infestans T30-4]EEY60829.1 conserved hypothetical protein [Phytophthora infestans T30-4]|eukprot:XP_002899775.1 conserved hypothetical protein [Phytophthora infestans T30-4]